MGGVVVTAYGLISDFADAAYKSFNNVANGVKGLYNGLGQIAPRAMEAITGVSSIADALNALKQDFMSPLKDDGFGIEGYGQRTKQNIENWVAMFKNMGAELQNAADMNDKAISARIS